MYPKTYLQPGDGLRCLYAPPRHPDCNPSCEGSEEYGNKHENLGDIAFSAAVSPDKGLGTWQVSGIGQEISN